LSGNNLYTGTTTVSGGTLTLTGTNATPTVNITGGTLALDGSGGVNLDILSNTAAVTLSGSGNFDISAIDSSETIGSLAGSGTVALGDKQLVVNGGTTSSSSVISGSGSSSLVRSGSGNLTLSGNNLYTGTTTVSGGTLTLTGTNATPTVNITGGTLALDGSGGVNLDILSNTAAVTLSGSGNFDISAIDSSETIGSLAGTAGAVALGGKSLVVGNASNTTFAGSIDGSGGSLTKQGSGTLTLSGALSHTGTTTVSNGALVVNGNQTAGSMTVGAGATLGGTGTVNNATISGIHSPGNSPGVQTATNGLSYVAGSTFNWELISNTDPQVRGTDFDGVNVTSGTLTIASGVTSNLIFNATGSTVDWNNSFWGTDRTWLVFSDANSPTLNSGSIFDTINVSADSNSVALATVRPDASFAWTTNGSDVQLSYSAVPEPGTMLLMGVGALAGCGSLVRRFTRRRKEQNPA
jgi:autotransporter-associated beta strand protein